MIWTQGDQTSVKFLKSSVLALNIESYFSSEMGKTCGIFKVHNFLCKGLAFILVYALCILNC